MTNIQKTLILIVLIINFYFLFIIFRYWKADIYYNKLDFKNALLLIPKEPNYISKLALTNGDVETALKALILNPYNQNVRKILVSNLVKNSDKEIDNLLLTEGIVKDGIEVSPHDPRLYYQLGILQLKIDKNNDAIKSLEKSIELKANYKEARFALGATYKELGENEKAKKELDYILKYIDPNDELTKKYLEGLK